MGSKRDYKRGLIMQELGARTEDQAGGGMPQEHNRMYINMLTENARYESSP